MAQTREETDLRIMSDDGGLAVVTVTDLTTGSVSGSVGKRAADAIRDEFEDDDQVVIETSS